MQFGSVCSGIEAASVAWAPLGWKAAWLAEIEPFPCAVLAHHYPSVPNLGDMTKIASAILVGEVPAPDLFCGGTPCQAFSVAGLRESLDDARGNLTLKFVEIANAIDHVRIGRGEDECIVFWENVPGVLSTKDNAFGCFLAGLAGEDDPLEPPGGKWTNAGCVLGPKRAVAWRVLDAQFFGVAQRRRRVFVVASARKGFDPAQVLFEWDGVRRDSAPSREARQTAPTIPSRSTAGGGLGTDFDCDGGVITMANGQGGEGFDASEDGTGRGTPLVPVGVTIHGTDPTVRKVASYDDLAQCLRARTPGNIDNSSTTVVQQPVAYAIQAGAIKTNPNIGPDGVGVRADDCAYTLEARAEVQAVAAPISYGIRTANTSSNGWGVQEEATHTLDGAMGIAVAHPIHFDTTQVSSAANYSNPQAGDPCHPLAAGAHAPAIAFPANLSGTQCASTEELAPSMGALNPTAVAVALRGREGGATAELGDEVQNCLRASSGGGDKPHVLTAMQVRRLTPTECERLQGFPDGYTAIPWRKKPASECPDGPRYKALGNSWAVPNVTWIGRRIQAALRNS